MYYKVYNSKYLLFVEMNDDSLHSECNDFDIIITSSKNLISYYSIDTSIMFYTFLNIVALVITYSPVLIFPKPPTVTKHSIYYHPPSPPTPPPIYIWVDHRDNSRFNEQTEDYDGDSS